MDFVEAPGTSPLLPGWSVVSLPFTTNDVRHIPLLLVSKASLKNNCCTFVPLDSLVVVDLASSLHIFVVD